MDINVGADARENKKDKWENYEYSPAAQPTNGTTLGMGLMLRAFCVMLLTFGLLLFVDDALVLGCGTFGLLLRALVTTSVFSLLLVGRKKTVLIALGIAAASAIITVALHPNIFAYLTGSINYTVDSAMRRLVSLGFKNYSVYIKEASDMGLAAVELHRGAATVAAIALSLIFSVCTVRKTVLLPTLAVSLGILMCGFTFNLSSSNWGFAITLLPLFAITVMKMFDANFKTKRKDRLNTASLGGYAGAAALLIAFLSVVIPALTVKNQWGDIKYISGPMDIARDVVDSVITGNAPNLKDMGIVKNMDEFNSRNVTAKHLVFTGEKIVTVETAYTRDLPIYLRGWLATGFDGTSWTTVTNDQLAAFNDRFEMEAINAGYSDGAYHTEYMTGAFYEMIDPSLLQIDPEKGYTNNFDDGFISMYLNVEMELGQGTGNLLYIPSIMGTSGLLKHEQREGTYKYDHRSYFDGIYITGWLNLHKKYSTQTYVPIMSNKNFGANLMTDLNYYKAMCELMRWYMVYHKEDAPVEEVLTKYGFSELIGQETYFDKFIAMSKIDQELYYARYVTLVNEYSRYVEEMYGRESNHRIALIDQYATEILAEVGEDAFTHDKVIAVVQFLTDNFSYSLEPRLPSSLVGYDSFLRETREGYCVQFATTATLILRSMGIPARYVEGYIASSFNPEQDEDGQSTGMYVCEVTDRQAHAWVEVYYEGYGWMPYETTKQYLRTFYGSVIENGSSSTVPGTPGTNTGNGDDHANPEEPLPPPEELPPEPVATPFPTGKVVGTVLGILAVIGLGYFAYTKLRQRAENILLRRRQRITDAINGSVEDDEFEERAKEINIQIFNMFALGGCTPNLGELPQEYARRMEEDSPLGRSMPFSSIMNIMQKQEFGNGVSKAELSTVAEYLDGLWKDVYRSKSRTQQFWYRYIRCVI
ncbi:MAG: transglutaminase domain-containing protein [Clostridia bacterium]|nr:transglutaminase domain-containing protein [Clostridia bacterium]